MSIYTYIFDFIRVYIYIYMHVAQTTTLVFTSVACLLSTSLLQILSSAARASAVTHSLHCGDDDAPRGLGFVLVAGEHSTS